MKTKDTNQGVLLRVENGKVTYTSGKKKFKYLFKKPTNTGNLK